MNFIFEKIDTICNTLKAQIYEKAVEIDSFDCAPCEYKENYADELYAEIKKAVNDGRWEVEGAMWLEADCNLTSGESLVRQIMFGKRFMKEEFGVDSKILWLPDVFGYSAALPQILKKTGVDKFVTSKISWNEENKMPYDAFVWQGIDGSEVFTTFLPARDTKPFGENDSDDRFTTYNGYIQPSQVLGTWKRFQQKEYSKETIITFGWGDGGGGPTKDMLEQQRRLAYGLPGFPKTRMDFAGSYLERLEDSFYKNAKLLKRMPKWVGELYLELHRGTYTSIAKNKRNNRKSELAYRRVESVSVLDMLVNGGKYPQEEINSGWQTILLNQFHDIIPGSSIREVYEDSDRMYKEVLDSAEKIEKEKLHAIAENVGTDGVLVYNANGFEMSGTVSADGVCAYAENIPPFGYKVLKKLKQENTIRTTKDSIENKFFKVRMENGNISSIYDKINCREIIKPGEAGNEIQVFEDFPKCYDAWKISNYYKQKMWTVSDVTEQTPISDGARAGIRVVKKFLDSEIAQNIWLYEDIDRIDFETVIDWKQEHMLVKAAFLLDIHSNEASYDIQFGNLKRPTHENTSWDAAKFEVCAHKWADISDGSYGVSLLNDCKYGYNAEGSMLKLTLLKCATYPNPDADKCIHKFCYSLYPHSGNVYEGDTIKRGYELNQPLVVVKTGTGKGSLPESFSLISCDCDNVVAETVKKAEDGGGVIVRMYEAKDRRCKATLTAGFDFDEVYLCNLLEENEEKLESSGNTVTIPVKNYEIVTLKFLKN